MPLKVICTSPENPLSACTLTCIPEAVAPWLTVSDEGEMLITKSGEGGGGGRTSPVVPPPQPVKKAPARIAQQLDANRESLFSVMRMFAANSGGAPKLEVPVVTALDNALAGRESILRYGGVHNGQL